MAIKMKKSKPQVDDKKAQEFILKGGGLPENENDGDHRLTLRMPKWLLEKIDQKRKLRLGSISRNLWILEQIEKSVD